jgi:hypothetical protein
MEIRELVHSQEIDKRPPPDYKRGMSNQFCQWCGQPTNNDDSLSGHKLKTCGNPACLPLNLPHSKNSFFELDISPVSAHSPRVYEVPIFH